MENYKMEIYCIETTEGLQWNVEFPEVPGCGGAGDTVDEAIQDARINLSVHLDYLREEGLPVPVPCLSLPIAEFSGKLSLRIPRSLHKKIAEYAQKEDVSINSYINNALSEYMGQTKAFDAIRKDLVESLQQNTYNIITSQLVMNLTEKGWKENFGNVNLVYETNGGF